MLPLVALVGFGLMFFLRKDAAKTTDVCDELFDDPKEVLACKAAKGLLGAVADAVTDTLVDAVTNYEDVHGHNVAVNGPITEYWDAGENKDTFLAASPLGFGENGYSLRTYSHKGPNGEAFPKRHDNGCVPLPGHPDWSKCGPGTKSAANAIKDPGHGPIQGSREGARDAGPAPARWGGGFSERPSTGGGDPLRDGLSFAWNQRPSAYKYERVGDGRRLRDLNFPLAVPNDGSTAWVVRGEPVVCAPGTEVRGRDHRTGLETRSPCSPANQVPAPPVVQPTRDADGCIRYYDALGNSIRDCRTGATMPPGASTSPPLGRTGTARIADYGTGGGTVTNGSYR
jgi:hypothetical protein